MKKRFFAGAALMLAALLLFLSIAQPAEAASAQKTGKGIYGNGTWGLTIDIYDATFTRYAEEKSWGQYAYGNEGCAWFAAARVNQITGKDVEIYSGANWYNNQYKTWGFTRGTALPVSGQKALACYSHHVSVVEAVKDGQYLVSECAISTYKDYDYCSILIKTAEKLKNSSDLGTFLGFVYLTEAVPEFPASKKPALPDVVPVSNGLKLTWQAFPNATGYRIYRRTDPSAGWTKLKDVKKLTYTDTAAEAGTVCYYTIRAFQTVGETKTYSKYNKTGTAGIWLNNADAPSVNAEDGKLTVSISAVAGAEGYLLSRKTAESEFKEIAVLTSAKKRYADTDVISGTTYYYMAEPYTDVTGQRVLGGGTLSEGVMAYQTPAEPVISTLYETLSEETQKPEAVVWFLGNDSADYTLYRREAGTQKWKKVKTLAYKEAAWSFSDDLYYSVTDTAVKKGKTYEYTVQSHRTVGTHDLKSKYGTKKASVYIAAADLWNFLSGYMEYREIAKSSTRTYQWKQKKQQTLLLKQLYCADSCYAPELTPFKKVKKVVTAKKADPRGKFPNGNYTRIKVQALNWAAKQIFHCTDANIAAFEKTLKNNKKAGQAYIEGKYLYAPNAGRGALPYAPRFLKVQEKKGYLYVTYRIEDQFGGKGITEKQCAVLKKQKIQGVSYWTLYTHNAEKFLAP